MGSMPANEETLALYEMQDAFSKEVDEKIKTCALAKELRADPRFTESRPVMKIPAAMREHNLTDGLLQGPGMIVVSLYHWNEEGGKSMVSIFYLGIDLSGYPGIIHGGMLATMLDEGLASCAYPAMPNKTGVTANLQINYRKPVQAGQFLVLRAQTTKIEGRKGWAEGWIESLEVPEGETLEKLVEASALFVEPKHAKVSVVHSPDWQNKADRFDAAHARRAPPNPLTLLFQST
jgi:acyl-coenzyme A thioesterase PaaI-like protein